MAKPETFETWAIPGTHFTLQIYYTQNSVGLPDVSHVMAISNDRHDEHVYNFDRYKGMIQDAMTKEHLGGGAAQNAEATKVGIDPNSPSIIKYDIIAKYLQEPNGAMDDMARNMKKQAAELKMHIGRVVGDDIRHGRTGHEVPSQQLQEVAQGDQAHGLNATAIAAVKGITGRFS